MGGANTHAPPQPPSLAQQMGLDFIDAAFVDQLRTQVHGVVFHFGRERALEVIQQVVDDVFKKSF